MGAYDSGIEHLHKMSRLAQCRQRIEESFESSGPAQAPEPLPDGVLGAAVGCIIGRHEANKEARQSRDIQVQPTQRSTREFR
jgi:hypothetical protein